MATRTEVSNNLVRQIINTIAFVAFVVITVCAGSIPYNNNYLMDVVSKYNPDFMAAAYAGYILDIVIYVFLLCFIVYQGFTHRRNDKMVRSIDYLFLVYSPRNFVIVTLIAGT